MAFSQRPLPKFNHYSFDVIQNSQGKLLPSQNEALRELQEHFGEKSGCIGLVSMPTGSGKTGVISCLPYFLGMLGMSPPPEPGASPYGKPLHKFDKPVLVIAPDIATAKQLEQTLTVSADAAGENFLLKRNIIPPHAAADGVLPVGHKIKATKHVCNAEFLRNNDVIIANAQKFLKDEWEEVLPEDIFKLVIVDEAHHHPSITWRRIIQKFRNHALVVFFTATPFRGDGQSVLPKEEGKIVYHLPLQNARQQRIIRGIYWLEPLVAGGTDVESFNPILEKVKSIQENKDATNPLPDGSPHMAIAITKNIAYAEQVADFWNNAWGNYGSAIAYHSDVRPKSRRKTMMEAIKANRVKLVVVVESLLEGFDHPPISIAAIMTKIVSPVKFAQFIGRAQRIVRVREGPENGILADVVTHTIFQQEENIKAFEEERLIPVD